MGCWNETCMMSHLPIFSGEDVYAFLLMQTYAGSPCYSTGAYCPIVVVRGTYNDYGGIEKIVDESILSPVLFRFLKESGFSCEGDLLDTFTLEDLFNSDVVLEQKPWIQGKSPLRTTRVFMKASFLDQMLIAFRTENSSHHNMFEHNLNQALTLLNTPVPDFLKPDTTEYKLEEISLRDNARRVFSDLIRLSMNASTGCRWDIILEELGKPGVRELFVPYFLILLDTCAILDKLRMSWHVPSGLGSQTGYDVLYDRFSCIFEEAQAEIRAKETFDSEEDDYLI